MSSKFISSSKSLHPCLILTHTVDFACRRKKAGSGATTTQLLFTRKHRLIGQRGQQAGCATWAPARTVPTCKARSYGKPSVELPVILSIVRYRKIIDYFKKLAMASLSTVWHHKLPAIYLSGSQSTNYVPFSVCVELFFRTTPLLRLLCGVFTRRRSPTNTQKLLLLKQR